MVRAVRGRVWVRVEACAPAEASGSGTPDPTGSVPPGEEVASRGSSPEQEPGRRRHNQRPIVPMPSRNMLVRLGER